MPIEVRWYNDEKTIALWKFSDRWTWDDYRATLKLSNQILAAVDHKVDIIADMHESTLPRDSYINFRQIDRQASPNRRYVVVVGANAFVQSMITVANRVFRRGMATLLMASSLDAAAALLREKS